MASNESVAAELRKLLMKNNQLEQLLLANWVAGDNPGAIVNIPGLAEGIAELLGEAAHTGSLEPLIAQLEAPDPALEELRQAARDEALREPANEKP